LDNTNVSNEKSHEPGKGKKPYNTPSLRILSAPEVAALPAEKLLLLNAAATSAKKPSG
jgi:hypothetical protein